MIDVLVEPNGAVAAAHLHPYQTEVFEVVEGELTFKVGGETIIATARRDAHRRARHRSQVLELRRHRRPLPLRGTPGAPVRAADRDDVLARHGRQDEQEGDAEPVPARRDREPSLRRRAAAVPAALDPEARSRRWAHRSAGCSATGRTTSPAETADRAGRRGRCRRASDRRLSSRFADGSGLPARPVFRAGESGHARRRRRARRRPA